jgi:hypothetical protein
MTNDVKDFTIRWPDHPKYLSTKLVENDPIEVIAQKLEMILYTNKGEVLSEPGMGANLAYYLWSTSVPIEFIKVELQNQINKFIPELNNLDFTMDLQLYKGTDRDILYLNFTISDKNINFIFQ